MSRMRPQAINIVGGGLAGALLALGLARRGFDVRVYERRPDPRLSAPEGGRSINLALAERGIEALKRFGVLEAVQPLLIAMRGRLVHQPGAAPDFFAYGLRENEVIFSVSRAALNRVLIEAAERGGATLKFRQRCLGADTEAGVLRLRDEDSGSDYTVALAPTVAADGAGSALRASLVAAHLTEVREDRLEHDYKELIVPARAGHFAFEPHGLHIWPRGGFMLIALPNLDASFTATLFLAREGNPSFAELARHGAARHGAVAAFFAEHFPDFLAAVPDLTEQFAEHAARPLSTIHASMWHVNGQALLLGDAAHAIVPFHGQGMNAAFEDCATFDRLLEEHADWHTVFSEFERLRRPNAAAIAQMALENYVEMRDTVLNPKFQRCKAISVTLESRFPDRFVPRYSMVMFHAEISYADALSRGTIQAQILDELDARRLPSGEIDAQLAELLVRTRLPALDPAPMMR